MKKGRRQEGGRKKTVVAVEGMGMEQRGRGWNAGTAWELQRSGGNAWKCSVCAVVSDADGMRSGQ